MSDRSPTDISPARRPSRSLQRGRLVTVVPLDPVAHAPALYDATCGDGADQLWRYMADGPFPGRDAFDAALARRAESEDPLFFAIVETASRLPAGIAAYLRITPAHRVIEVGGIVFGPRLQRTAAATEAMYLMARHAFEDLGYRRYEWKCDVRNAASRRAALRLGFRFEGIFRQHMIAKGQNRDTAWYAMLDSEWPARKANFERWLDPSNFDAAGKQRESLSHLNA